VWHAREIVVQSRQALRLERFLARRYATTVVAISAAVAEQLDPQNVRIVMDEPDPRRFNPRAAGQFRRRFGIDDAVPLIGFVGRLDTWKGVETLLDAMPVIRRSLPRATVALVGGPVSGKEGYAAALTERTKKLGDAFVTGEVADSASAIADLDVLVLPSTEPEPYGLVVVEALACGVPAVVTRHGGAEEIARDCSAVRVIPPSDATSLAQACLELLGPAPDTSTAARRARAALRPPREVDHTEVFSAACQDARAERRQTVRNGRRERT
jgi:glycosyltransferase involved in cell wall biosynthesis